MSTWQRRGIALSALLALAGHCAAAYPGQIVAEEQGHQHRLVTVDPSPAPVYLRIALTEGEHVASDRAVADDSPATRRAHDSLQVHEPALSLPAARAPARSVPSETAVWQPDADDDVIAAPVWVWIVAGAGFLLLAAGVVFRPGDHRQWHEPSQRAMHGTAGENDAAARLLQACEGNAGIVARLVGIELRRAPYLSKAEAHERALARLKRNGS